MSFKYPNMYAALDPKAKSKGEMASSSKLGPLSSRPRASFRRAMTTVQAATGSQSVLDHAPKAKATDLRKSRSAFNNIILTSTGTAKALGLVIPEMKRIALIAESVTVPVTTGSFIILALLIQDASKTNPINRELVNDIYRKAVSRSAEGYLVFSEEQNVSSGIIGLSRAAAVSWKTLRTFCSICKGGRKLPITGSEAGLQASFGSCQQGMVSLNNF